MKKRISLAITIMTAILLGIAFVPMAAYQAEAQNNECRPQQLGIELVNVEPVLTWTAPSDCTPGSYEIYRRAKTTGESWSEPFASIASGITGATYTDTNTEVGNTYRYRVKADIGARKSKIAGIDVAVPEPRIVEPEPEPEPEHQSQNAEAQATPPGQVTDLMLESQNESIRATWTAPSDNGDTISEYRVEWGQSNGGFTSAAVPTGNTSHNITGLTNGLRYKVRVRAKNGQGDGPWSNLVLQYPWEQQNPLPLKSFSADISDSAMALTWVLKPQNLGPGTFVRHDIHYGTEVDTATCDTLVGTTVQITSSSVRTHTLSGLTNGTRYAVCFRTVSTVDGAVMNGTWTEIRDRLVTLRLLPPQFELSVLGNLDGFRMVAAECSSPHGCPNHYEMEHRESGQDWTGGTYATNVTDYRHSPNKYTYIANWIDEGGTQDVRVRSIRSGNISNWSPVQSIRIAASQGRAEDTEAVIRIYFDQYEIQRDSSGNAILHDDDSDPDTPDIQKELRVNEVDSLEGYTREILVTAECDPCTGVGNIVIPLHYVYYSNSLREATKYQDRLTIQPTTRGATKPVNLSWKSNHDQMTSNQRAQVYFGKFTYREVDKIDSDGNPVQDCEPRLDGAGNRVLDGAGDPVEDCVTVQVTLEEIARGLDIPGASEGDSDGQGKYLNIVIKDHDPDRDRRYVISNSATEYPPNLEPRSISGPSKTSAGLQLSWDMRKIQGISYYDWNSNRRVSCQLSYMSVKSNRNLTVPEDQPQANNIQWILPTVSSQNGNITNWRNGRHPGRIEQKSGYTRYINNEEKVYVDHYDGNGNPDDEWNRITLIDASTVGRSGRVNNYSLQGLFTCGSITRYSDRVEINRAVSLP